MPELAAADFARAAPGAFAATVFAALWILVGWLDYACHRRLGIEHTSGTRESLLHLAMLAQMGTAVLAALLFTPNAASFAVLFAACLLHEATVWLDLAYSSTLRRIPWFEQWVHGIQQTMPWVALAVLAVLHPQAALSVFGFAPADWQLRWRDPPLPPLGVAAFLAASVVFVVLPFLAEYRRCRRAEAAAAG